MTLFSMEPQADFESGQIVDAQLMWGNERVMVIEVVRRDGWPALKVTPQRGGVYHESDAFVIDVGRCSAIEPSIH